LDATYKNALAAAGFDANDPAALDKLTTHRFEHHKWSGELHSVRDEFHKLAPKGLQAFDAERTRCRQGRDSILERHPEWSMWTPNQADIDAARCEFDRLKEKLAEAAKYAHESLLHERSLYEQADRAFREVAEKLAGQNVLVKSLDDQLTRLGATSDLTDAIIRAQSKVEAAEAQVHAATLTDEERCVETRHQAAEAALKQREERLRDNEHGMRTLEGKLSGTEGLHQKRINAEQTVNDFAAALAREQRQANAHLRIKELFEQIRQTQVQRTVGPVSDRVVQWMQHLGLSEYGSLDFGDQLLPRGLVPRAAVSDGSVSFDDESYGTLEQLSILVRLALGTLLATSEPAVAILDDPFAHSDEAKHRRMIEVVQRAARGAAGDGRGELIATPLQIVILTCHPSRFDFIPDALHLDLEKLMQRD
jgi:hypothetical protein